MKKHRVDLDKTGQFSGFFLDYLAGKESLKPFYTHLPRLESFGAAIESKKFSKDSRESLVRVLEDQYVGVELPDAAQASLKALKKETTFTVTTGHQLNLFTGPLYFIYKIISTINLAKRLNEAYPGKQFVPVYWMATEDHDFDEINYFKLDGKKYQWSSAQTGAVGEFELDGEFKAFLKEVSFAPEVFLKAYQSSKTLSEAVRKYVNGLFGDQGLLIVDGNHSDLKSQFKSVIGEDLFGHKPYGLAQEASQRLGELGYKTQIFPREINFFYLKPGIRERIERVGDYFEVLNTDLKFTEAEMETEISAHPERFSPNVVLRPLYQEMILPNLAYLGGPAEVVYWLQLKGIFDHFHVPFPILLPRNFALLIENPIRKKMDQLGWSVEDLFVEFEAWKKSHVVQQAQVDFSMKEERDMISLLLDKKGKEAASLEKSLDPAFQAGKSRMLKVVDQLGTKLRKAEERRLEVDLLRAKSVLTYTAPGGSPQERVVNMMQFYLSHPSLVEDLGECFDPLDFSMMVLEYS